MDNTTNTPPKVERTDFISKFFKKLPFIIVGILIGIITVVIYQGHLTTMTTFMYNSALVVFGAMVLTFVLVFGFREYLTRFVFGKKIEKAGDLIDDAQQASNTLIDRLADRFLTDADSDLKDQVKTLAPRFANWFVWGRLRNWWWQWLVGIATFLVGLVGTLLLINQNELLKNQNTLIQRQMSLEEASRRSSLVVLMGNIMDKVDDEINRQRKPKDTDATRYKLSASLIGQIAALSHSFKPYKYMDGDTLIEKPLSPERGHLLITITRLSLDTLTFQAIFRTATFQVAALQGAILDSAYLVGANLREADLYGSYLTKADMKRANLSQANLHSAILYRADLSEARLDGANFFGAGMTSINLTNSFLPGANFNFSNLAKAKLLRADLRGANLSNTFLTDTDFENADMSGVFFNESDLTKANFKNVYLRKAGFTNTKLNSEQLLQTFTLYQSFGLNDSLKNVIIKVKPELFQEPKY
jgi:uncharacterized protein YjbI with pentapeptide repeats